MGERTRRERRRLLVAAVGVATVSFVAEQGCSSRSRYETFTSGNLVPPPHEAGSQVMAERDAGSRDQPDPEGGPRGEAGR